MVDGLQPTVLCSFVCDKNILSKKLGLLLSIKNQCHSIVLVHAQYTLYIYVSHPN